MTSLWAFRIAMSLALLGSTLSIGSASASAQTNDSERISKLFAEAKGYTVQARDDAATLNAYTLSKISWESHAGRLTTMKVHVNNLGKVLSQLHQARPQGSAWQQHAIDDITPLLQGMADHLTAAINHLNENPSQVHMKAYQDYARSNYLLTRKTCELVEDLVDYDEAKSTADSLERKLTLPQK
ncbi:MAG: hypothetical protein KGL37_00870 [Acidobacteriota bacterium]|nr:hypothetical protein [Acidobacteriota bacterium]